MSIEIGLWLSVLSLTIWIVLVSFWGQFWRCNQQFTRQETDLPMFPSVCVVVPARNEADVLPISLRSLLTQDYPGSLSFVLVDDGSTDGTASVAFNIAQELNKSDQLKVLSAEPLPSGWTGKLWALHQGIQYTQTLKEPPDYFLLSDADIEHDALNVRSLVVKAQQENLELVSLMVKLRCEHFWEKLLIPAFVFFFQKLYPFPWVNDPTKPTAAAAGGCILISREALNEIGGIESIRTALIDDCTLAQAVKKRRLGIGDKGEHSILSSPTHHSPLTTPPQMSSPTHHSPLTTPPKKGRIWLGLTHSTYSLRPYTSLETIWNMVARTAFTQLHYSLGMLIVTLFGMILVYMVPPLCAITGAIAGNWIVAIVGLFGWLLMSYAYFPTVKFYSCSPLFAFCLSAIAFLYTLMTLDSALRHWQKRGGAWKGRVYSETLG
ncbi:glycosyl transferase family 2 [Scytonema hofmannii PCC 7110]|uniref:Glycosyl transferase family 2 n=1 Tax=Scytonema hofmannii PCC 7110 TaxID=128403 RepID=A0A139X9Q7_9CYAN|nr:glycosyltransferase [Scytonema hofmannii]KYC41415.1 glycosyl transferase family 2 [Scytonema hofmannii PCC 7110]